MTPRTARLEVRMRPDDFATLRAAAQRDGVSLSAWVALVCLRAARAGEGASAGAGTSGIGLSLWAAGEEGTKP